jgi:hypothetical protein
VPNLGNNYLIELRGMDKVTSRFKELWAKLGFTQKTVIIYFLVLLLMGHVSFLTAYLSAPTSPCEGRHMTGLNLECNSPLEIYIQTPFMLLFFGVYGLQIILLPATTGDHWVGSYSDLPLLFAAWLLGVPIFLLIRLLYRLFSGSQAGGIKGEMGTGPIKPRAIV